MLPDYSDITSRIAEAPKWWDSNGLPRYNEFHPNDVPDIYAREVVLYRIDCQACGQQFTVADQWKPWRHDTTPLSEQDLTRLHYGDPPRHGGCSGETMNCEDRRVLQFWQSSRTGWTRVPALEGIVLDEGEEK